MSKDSEVMQIQTGGNGTLRVWESSVNGICWATPNGSEGISEPSIEAAISAAFEAEGLNPEEYGYNK